MKPTEDMLKKKHIKHDCTEAMICLVKEYMDKIQFVIK